MNTPLRNRRTIRNTALSIGIPPTTLWDILKRGNIRRVSTTLKPLLTDQNKRNRVEWALSFVDRDSLAFASMYDYVHLDEKWFFLCKETNTFYLAKDEANPHIESKSKRFLPKVMFLCAVARPRFDDDGLCVFDGKLGIWPFVERAVAQRSSRSRPAGTVVLQSLSVTKEVYETFITHKVIPAIRAKFPRDTRCIFAQHDNAPAHGGCSHESIQSACSAGNWSINIVSQPPNSPDFNILDLGFFRAIQSIQYRSTPKDMKELIKVIEAAFDAYEPRKLDDTFLTLQKCLELSLRDHGGSRYKLPHMHKQSRRTQGDPLTVVHCDRAIYNLANNIMREPV